MWVKGREEPRVIPRIFFLPWAVGWIECRWTDTRCWWLIHTAAQERSQPIHTVSGNSPMPAFVITAAWGRPKTVHREKMHVSNVR